MSDELDENEELRDLPFTLTEDESIARGQEQARLISALDAEEIEKKADGARHKDSMKDLNAQIRKLNMVIRSGRENCPVRCIWVMNDEGSRMDLTRRDTGEVVETRAMTDDERQGSLV